MSGKQIENLYICCFFHVCHCRPAALNEIIRRSVKNDEHEMDSVGEVRGESSNKKTFLKNRKPEENANHGFDNDSFSGTE